MRTGAICCLIALVAMLLVGCGHEKPLEEPSELPAKSVATVRVSEGWVPETAEATGTVQAVAVAEIAPKVMARVQQVYVNEGDRVRRGQVLVRLDDADLRAAVEQAEAGLKQARAHYEQAKVALDIERTRTKTDVGQARQAVAAAKAQLDKVRTGPRPQQLKQAEEAVRIAKAGLAQAQEQLDLVKEGFRRQQKAQADQAVRQAEQQVALAKSGLAEAQAHLNTVQADYNRIKALYEAEVVPKQQFDHMELQLVSARESVKRAQAQVVQAEAGLEQAKQQKDLVYEGFRSQEVQQAEEAVKQAQAQYNQALHNLDMAREGGRKEDVAAAEAQYKQAQEALRAALAAEARVKLREEDVKNARAAVAQAEAGLRAARVMLSYTTIIAPFDGVVTARMVDPGDMATPGMPVIRVDDDTLYRLVATVPESQAATLGLGTAVECVIDALDSLRLKARISQIIPAADPASRTLTVKADLPHHKGLKSGLFGRLVFTVRRSKALVVPSSAVIELRGLVGVWVVEEGHATFRIVKTGKTYDGKTRIISGLKTGDVVIVEGMEELREGQPVSPTRSPTPAQAEPQPSSQGVAEQ